MGLSIGRAFSKIFHRHPADDGESVGHEIKEGADKFVGGISAISGLLELTGIKFPVDHYQAKVSDSLYRGSRLDESDYPRLRQQGIKAIVDLTAEGTRDEKLAPKNGFNLLNVKIIDNTPPSTAQMKEFLDFVTAPENQPAYVHCEAGKGRTGVAVACYRMAVQGWSADQAIAEGARYGLQLGTQIEFIRDFDAKLRGGKIEGYPRV
jgi:protein-tyrosine phosphatase